jgi:hypothetical protein
MISLEQYVGVHSKSKDWTDERKKNAISLLSVVNKLLGFAIQGGVRLLENPSTHSGVSGQTFGGFRPQDCPQGAPKSSHKEGLAVDIYDPDDKLDTWCKLPDNLALVESCGIYFEHPSSTKGWCHMTIKRPGSGNRWFYP